MASISNKQTMQKLVFIQTTWPSSPPTMLNPSPVFPLWITMVRGSL